MPDVEGLTIKDGDEEYQIYIQSTTPADDLIEDEPGYRAALPTVDLQEVHNTIRGYAKYAIGAFKNLGDAQVEKITLKFGLKVGGKAGLPILSEASGESNFEITVECKFPQPPKTGN